MAIQCGFESPSAFALVGGVRIPAGKQAWTILFGAADDLKRYSYRTELFYVP